MAERAIAENPHKNHRSRLRARFLRSGLSDFAPHNVLELLLFYAIPRRDTNPIAHALLSRFGTVGGVLAADEAALVTVPGVSVGTARFLRVLRDLLTVAGRPRRTDRRYSSAEELGGFFAEVLKPCRGDGIAYAFFDNDFGLLSYRTVHGISIHSPRFSPTSITEEALIRHAPMCAVAHVHGDGLALPGSADLDTTRLLRTTLEAAGVRLVEHFIVAGKQYATLLYRYSGSSVGTGAGKHPVGVDPEELACLDAFFSVAACRADPETLLSEHGGLFRLLSAPAHRHLYGGVDERTAALLSLPFALHAYAVSERPVPPSDDIRALGEYLKERYFGVGEETVLLFLFDRDGQHCATHTVGIGSVGEATISVRRVAEKALFDGAASAVLVHNHPDGIASPSEEDRATTGMIAEALRGIGVELLHHYIVAGSDYCTVE